MLSFTLFATQPPSHYRGSPLSSAAEEPPAALRNRRGTQAANGDSWALQPPEARARWVMFSAQGFLWEVHTFPALIPILISRIVKNFVVQLKEVYCPITEKGREGEGLYRKQFSERQPLFCQYNFRIPVELQIRFLFLAPLSGLDCGTKKKKVPVYALREKTI